MAASKSADVSRLAEYYERGSDDSPGTCLARAPQVYHIGEYSGRALEMFGHVRELGGAHKLEAEFGLKGGSIQQGKVLFAQMQCMHKVTPTGHPICAGLEL